MDDRKDHVAKIEAESSGANATDIASDGGESVLTARAAKLLVIMVATMVGLYLCYRLALPFVSSLTWALVLAVVLAPAHGWLEARVADRNLAATLSVAMASVAVVVLLLLVAQQLVREAATGAAYLETALHTFDLREVVGNHPRLAEAAAWIEERLDIAGAVGAIAQWLTTQSTSLLRGSINQVISLVLTFYLLFYFLRDRHRAMRAVFNRSPLTPHETARVIDRFADTVYATIFGTVAVAIVQGTLGALMFWWLGLPTPVFWGVVMGLLAIVPVLGAFVIWVPAAAFLAFKGEWGRALVLVAWGGVIIATIDNLLYPVLVGNRLRLHSVAIFIGAVGGIVLFGASGLVLGPATIAVTLALVDIVRERFRSEPLTRKETAVAEKTTKDDDDAERLRREADEEPNRERELTFPASDPPKVTRFSYDRQHTPPLKGGEKPE